MISTLVAKGAEQRTSISAVVTRGDADEVAFVFNAGSAVAPFSVGAHGDWRVAAADVAPLHFYLSFDGETLFAIPGASDSMTFAAGKPLEATWTALPETCELRFGAASIAVVRSDARGPRVADPFGAETIAKPIGAFLAGAGKRQREAESFAAATAMRRPYGAAVGGRTASVRVSDPLAAETIAAPSPVGKILNGPKNAEHDETESVVVKPAPAAAKETPLVRKVLAGLIVTMVVVAGVRAFKMRGASENVATAAAPTAAKPAESASSPAAVRAAKRPPESLAPLPIVNGRSPQRQAVDRVARGAYSEAASLYEDLARRTNDPTFIAAARIARRKAQVR